MPVGSELICVSSYSRILNNADYCKPLQHSCWEAVQCHFTSRFQVILLLFVIWLPYTNCLQSLLRTSIHDVCRGDGLSEVKELLSWISDYRRCVMVLPMSMTSCLLDDCTIEGSAGRVLGTRDRSRGPLRGNVMSLHIPAGWYFPSEWLTLIACTEHFQVTSSSPSSFLSSQANCLVSVIKR